MTGSGARWTVLGSGLGLGGEPVCVPGTVHHTTAVKLKRAAQAARLLPTTEAVRKNSGFLGRRFDKDEIIKLVGTQRRLRFQDTLGFYSYTDQVSISTLFFIVSGLKDVE